MPVNTPTRTDRIVAAVTSLRVIGMRRASSSDTGCCVTDTRPKSCSNTSRWSQSRYRWTGGTSRLRVSVTSWTTEARWVGLVIASVNASGSPAWVMSM